MFEEDYFNFDTLFVKEILKFRISFFLFTKNDARVTQKTKTKQSTFFADENEHKTKTYA